METLDDDRYVEAWGRVGHKGRGVRTSTRSTKRKQSLENLVAQRARRVYTRSENADDSSFLLDAGYFRPATIFEGDSSRGFAAVLVRVCARWPTQHRRRRRRRRRRHRRHGAAPPKRRSATDAYTLTGLLFCSPDVSSRPRKLRCRVIRCRCAHEGGRCAAGRLILFMMIMNKKEVI